MSAAFSRLIRTNLAAVGVITALLALGAGAGGAIYLDRVATHHAAPVATSTGSSPLPAACPGGAVATAGCDASSGRIPTLYGTLPPCPQGPLPASYGRFCAPAPGYEYGPPPVAQPTAASYARCIEVASSARCVAAPSASAAVNCTYNSAVFSCDGSQFEMPRQLACRLPVYPTGGGGGIGFIAYPALRSESSPRVRVDNPAYDQYRSPSAYAYAGGRWVGVPSEWLSADGTRYVDVRSTDGSLYLVDHDTARPLNTPGAPFRVFRYSAEGIYVSPAAGGLMLVNPVDGAAKTVVATGSWQAVIGDYAYSAGPGPTSRLRLSDQQMVTLPTQLFMLGAGPGGFDYGLDPTGTVDRVLVDGGVVPVISNLALAYPLTRPASLPSTVLAMSDSNGLWISSTTGLWLYTGDLLERAWTTSVVIAGPCR